MDLKHRESSNLDLLRSLAVLMVLVDHLAATFGVWWRQPVYRRLGHWGVCLFFVHTSLVLMMSMGRMGLNGVSGFRAFYIRRAFRIYPLSFLTIAATLAFHIPRESYSPTYVSPGVGNLVSNVFLVQNLTKSASISAPLWSLPYEVQMYLVLPFLYVFLRHRARLGMLLVFGLQPSRSARSKSSSQAWASLA